MKASLRWIREFIDLPGDDPVQVGEVLSNLGIDVESIEVIEAGAFVLAAGPWMGKATEWLGIDMPISPLKGQILRLKAPGEPLAASLSWSHNYATTKPDGLGMGLSVNRSIVEAHGGTMWMTQNPDRGVTVSFTLPVAPVANP